jgi:hypothetical protein
MAILIGEMIKAIKCGYTPGFRQTRTGHTKMLIDYGIFINNGGLPSGKLT